MCVILYIMLLFLRFFLVLFFFLVWSEGLRMHSGQIVKPLEGNCDLRFWAIKIKFT